ncbi:MAG: ISNCY-like element ISTvo2 family transposase [Thermoplasmataceae archaeon]
MFRTVISLASMIRTFFTNVYILSIYYTFVITQDRYEEFRDSIDALIQQYREKFSVPVITDWKEYEKSYRARMLGMSKDLREMIEHASNIEVDEFGRPSLLDAKEKTFILLAKEIIRMSNRRMAYSLPLFGIGRKISYKTVERLYSDPLVIMILNNMFMETLRKKGVSSCDAIGDGTGYSITVTKHYRSLRQTNGESVKKGQFVYSFALMDLKTRMYIGYAISMKSEKDAYYRALDMIERSWIELNSVRLDKYYSGQSILDDFDKNTKIFIILKKNSRIRGRRGWREIIRRFMEDPMSYLREYFRRSNSESGFSADKRATGHMIFQRREDRIETSGFCKGLLHNMMLMNG